MNKLFLSAFFSILSVVALKAVASLPTSEVVPLKSQEGVAILVRYNISAKCLVYKNEENREVSLQLADPVAIQLIGTPDGAKEVTAKIEFWERSKIYHGGPNPKLQRTYSHYDRSVKLEEVSSNAFKGYLDGSVATRMDISSSATSYEILQTLEISVDGKTLIDPVSGTNKFLVSLGDDKGCSY